MVLVIRRNETTVYQLNNECAELEKDYKAKKLDKHWFPSQDAKEVEEGKLYGRKIGDLKEIITFCVKQVGKKNLEAATGNAKCYILWMDRHLSLGHLGGDCIRTSLMYMEKNNETPWTTHASSDDVLIWMISKTILS